MECSSWLSLSAVLHLYSARVGTPMPSRLSTPSATRPFSVNTWSRKGGRRHAADKSQGADIESKPRSATKVKRFMIESDKLRRVPGRTRTPRAVGRVRAAPTPRAPWC